MPYGLIAQQTFSARNQLREAGLPVPRFDDPVGTFNSMREVIEIGLPTYFIAAALLALIGLGRTVKGR